MSQEASPIASPNHWRNIICATVLLVVPYILESADVMAAIAFAALAVIR